MIGKQNNSFFVYLQLEDLTLEELNKFLKINGYTYFRTKPIENKIYFSLEVFEDRIFITVDIGSYINPNSKRSIKSEYIRYGLSLYDLFGMQSLINYLKDLEESSKLIKI